MLRTLASFALVLSFSPRALAQEFAEAPGTPLEPVQAPAHDRELQREEELAVDFVPSSSLRVSVGPVLRVARGLTDGGLAAAVDIGSGAAGARLSGSWVRVGSDVGLAEYRGELFIDFGADRRLHPIIGAGAGVARLGTPESDGTTKTSTYGVGVLRGTVEYVLPVERADARVGLDASASVPAIQGKGANDASPWLLFTARVGVGF
jgi:hypothetical protein